MDSVVSVPMLDQKFFSGQADAAEFDPYAARVGMVALRGRFSVASSNELVRVIGADIKDHEVVVFDFSNTTHMDDSAALIVEQLIDTASDENTECIVMNLSGPVADSLNALNVFKNLPKDRFVDNLDEARVLARNLLGDEAE